MAAWIASLLGGCGARQPHARLRQGTVLVLLLGPFLLAGCAMRTRWQLTEGQSPRIFEAQVRKRVGLRFLLFLPAGYAKSEQRWPLLSFLHGSDERGDDLEHVKVSGPPRIVATRKDFPFVVVSRQLPPDRSLRVEERGAVRELPCQSGGRSSDAPLDAMTFV